MADIGDIFSIPLGDGRMAIGQVFEKKQVAGLAAILVFDRLFVEKTIPSREELQNCIDSSPAILASSFDNLIDRGDWKKLITIPPTLDRLHSPAFRASDIPFCFILEAYDGKRKRLARLREMRLAPRRYSISARWLEDVVKTYFRVNGTEWDIKFNKLLLENVVPFG